MGLSGLEPPTLRLSVVRSSQLSYKPVFAQSPDRTPLVPRFPQLEAQRSGFDLEKETRGMSELCRLRRSEGYGACVDVVEIVGIEPATSCLQGRRSPS